MRKILLLVALISTVSGLMAQNKKKSEPAKTQQTETTNAPTSKPIEIPDAATIKTNPAKAVGIDNPAVAKMDDSKKLLSGYWKYVKTEMLNEKKVVETKILQHIPKSFDVNINTGEIVGKSGPIEPGQAPPPVSAPSTNTKSTDSIVKIMEAIPFAETVQMFDPTFSYLIMNATTNGNPYIIYKKENATLTTLSAYPAVVNLSEYKGWTKLTIENSSTAEKVVFFVYKVSSSELIIADEKMKKVHFFYKVNQP